MTPADILATMDEAARVLYVRAESEDDNKLAGKMFDALGQMTKEANPEGGAWFLPFDSVNRAGDLAAKAKAIAWCVGMAVSREDEMPPNAMANACWAVADMIEEIEAITAMKREAKS
ncbi:hypothetical protein [Luteimonas lutimaris]|uniref:DUF3077 domain-containing protein n=1 Tax=Luteimonas lutimaris TaxID=698645 RepID=A0ABP7MR67_9GAMM